MARPIKVSQEQMDEVLADVAAKLKAAKLNNGKFEYSKVLNYIPNTKAEIYISEMAWLKMNALVQNFTTEIGWYGFAQRSPDETKNTYMIFDIIIPPQQVTGAKVDTDQAEMEAWLDSLSDEDFNDLHFHGHSHVNMSVVPSAVDISMYNDTVARIRQDSFYIFCILNKSGNRTFQIYDLKKNIFFDTSDITLLIGSEIGIQDTIQEAKSLVREKKYYNGCNTGYNYGGYNQGAYSGTYQSKASQPAAIPASTTTSAAAKPKTEKGSGGKKKKEKKKPQLKQLLDDGLDEIGELREVADRSDEPGEITVKIVIKDEESSTLVETYYGAQTDTIWSLIGENGLKWRDTIAKLDLVEVPRDAYYTALSNLPSICGLSPTMDHNLVLISEVDEESPFGRYGYEDDEDPYSAFGYM